MWEHLFAKKLIFISGKGGTGKTLVASCLAKLAAAQGKRVLLAESNAFDKLSLAFDRPKLGHQEVELSDNIYGINLDPKKCFQEYVVKHLGLESLYDKIFKQSTVQSFLHAIPGLDETMLLGRLFYTCELRPTDQYDLVIFDSPASGHFVNLLSNPGAIIDSGLMGPLVKQVQRVTAFLSDAEKCGAVLVTLPEKLVMTETFELITALQKYIPLSLDAVVLNRFFTKPTQLVESAHIQAYSQRKLKQSQLAQRYLQALLKQQHKDCPLFCWEDHPVLSDLCGLLTVEQIKDHTERVERVTTPKS